jgi:rubrerythrin
MRDVRVIDRDYVSSTSEELTVGMYQNPEALLFKGLHQSALRAWICASCGYTELFAQNPQELLRIYQQTSGQ